MKPVSEDLRMRIVSVYEEGESSFPQVAERFRVSVRSVKRFVGQFRETGSLAPEPAANGSQPVPDESDVQYLKGVLNSKTGVTQEELREMLRTATGKAVSQPTVCRTLRREGITRKKKTKRAEEQEREDVKAARRQFPLEMSSLNAEDMIFPDEMGCVTGMSRTYGYAPCGERAVSSEPAVKGERLTVIGAPTQDGFPGGLEIQGSVNGDVFETFITDVAVPHLQAGKIVLMDNASFRHRADIQELIEAHGAAVKFLPPYSPEFNPIEECWSKVKAWLRKQSARTVETLQIAITEAIGRITVKDAQGWFRHAGYQCQQ